MKIGIIGAGIGGLSVASLLYQIGHDVHVYEKNIDIQEVGAGIGVGSNVIKALKTYKMAYAIEQEGQILKGMRIISNKDEFLNEVNLGTDESPNVTILRSVLHEIFKNYIPKDRIYKKHKVKNFKQTSEEVVLYFENGEKEQFDLVIAADGLNSNIRQQIFPKSTPRYAGYTCFRGIVENKVKLDDSKAYEYWGHKGRFGIVPLNNNKLYWFCTINAKEHDSQYKSFEKPHLQAYFNQFPEPVRQVLDAQEETGILHHDIYDLRPLKQFVSGRVVLLGDAAHATTPNMGQGAGQAIEDAITLTNLLKENDIGTALKRYEKLRVKHTEKVILKSRKVGETAQMTSTFKINARNKMLKSISSNKLSNQTKFLQKVKLE